MPTTSPDCTTCGACCFGPSDRYIQLLPDDRDRAIPAAAIAEIDGQKYLRMADGHCAQLQQSADGRLICAIYDTRPEACRGMRAGSFECGKSRLHRLPFAEAFRHGETERPEAVLPPAHPAV